MGNRGGYYDNFGLILFMWMKLSHVYRYHIGTNVQIVLELHFPQLHTDIIITRIISKSTAYETIYGGLLKFKFQQIFLLHSVRACAEITRGLECRMGDHEKTTTDHVGGGGL